MTAIRLLIVDDHPIMRDGLRGVFGGDEDFEVVGEAGDGADAVQKAQALRPDVIIAGAYLDQWLLVVAAVVTAWSGVDYFVRFSSSLHGGT